MNPLKISLRHCRTYEDFEFDLPEGILAIVGQNGSGKSTLVSAIDTALFGPEGRSLADWYPRGSISDAPLQIELVFEHGGETYKVRRTYNPKGRGQSKTDLEKAVARYVGPDPVLGWADTGELKWEPLTVESQKATGDEIANLIGLTRDTFRSSSFLAQGDTGRFCEAPARERKRVLTEIVGADEWVPLLERARVEKRAAEADLDKIAGALERADEELAERPQVEAALAIAQSTAAETSAALQEATARLTTAREALAEARTDMERHRNAQNALQRAEVDVSELKDGIKEREAILTALTARLETKPILERAAALRPALEEEQRELAAGMTLWRERLMLEQDAAAKGAFATNARDKAAVLEDRAQVVLDGHSAEKCDRCGQTLDHDAADRAAASYRQEAQILIEGAESAENAVRGIHARLVELPTEAPPEGRAEELAVAISDCRTAELQLSALEEAARRHEELTDEVRRMRAGLPEREEALVGARAHLDALGPQDLDEDTFLIAIDREQKSLADAEFDLRRAQQDTARLEERLSRLDKIAADAKSARARRDTLHQEATLLANMEKACGPNGVPALILETVAIPQVEVEATRILGLLGGPAYACELRTLREKKTGGIADTLDIILMTEHGDRPYETFSGGEQARISFALRLALAQLLAGRKGSATGLLVIDEVEGLDAQGMAALVGVLEDLQRSVPRIIVVSHNPELRDAFENTLMLEHVDGRSRVAEAMPA